VDVIAVASDLKSRAMNERDIENWDVALELLTEAKTSLERALNELPAEDSAKDTKLLKFETSVNKALYGMLGTIGGVYRRRAASSDRQTGDLEAAVEFYDKGHEIEKRFVDSYNLTQRLVTRVLLDPPAAFDESEKVAKKNVPSELREAKGIIDKQISPDGARRKDEYAFADAAIIALILNEAQWVEAINKFINLAPKSSYARSVTVDLLKELEGGLKSSDDEAVRSLCKRIERALKLAS
jgi:tetratricopeptide (TPR) repeat protein